MLKHTFMLKPGNHVAMRPASPVVKSRGSHVKHALGSQWTVSFERIGGVKPAAVGSKSYLVSRLQSRIESARNWELMEL